MQRSSVEGTATCVRSLADLMRQIRGRKEHAYVSCFRGYRHLLSHVLHRASRTFLPLESGHVPRTYGKCRGQIIRAFGCSLASVSVAAGRQKRLLRAPLGLCCYNSYEWNSPEVGRTVAEMNSRCLRRRSSAYRARSGEYTISSQSHSLPSERASE